MATIKSFKDLEGWKKSRDLDASMYPVCEINQNPAKDYFFKDQVKQEVLSTSNHIAEGFEYNNDFYGFLRMAKSFCRETRNCMLFSVHLDYTLLQDVEDRLLLYKTLDKKM